MNQRVNELIKSISDLKYDASTGLFETDRRALYDLVEMTVRECLEIINRKEYSYHEADPLWETAELIKEHFGVEE